MLISTIVVISEWGNRRPGLPQKTAALNDIPSNLWQLAERLFPLCRQIAATGLWSAQS